MNTGLILATLACCVLATWSCEPNQAHNGCKINGNSCSCGYGCRNVYIYKTRRACLEYLREILAAGTAPPAPPAPERSSDICHRAPCSRGICIQTTNDAGFTCKCDGTGFYGQRCERACPTGPTYGMVFPHECIVI